MGVGEKIERGRLAIRRSGRLQAGAARRDREAAAAALVQFDEVDRDLGYGYLEKARRCRAAGALTFYGFHIMVLLGGLFPLICLLFLYFTVKGTVEQKRWLLRAGITTFFLAMHRRQAGWVVAEVGRQPWAIQGLLPVTVATLQPDHRHRADDLLPVPGPVHGAAHGRGQNHAQADIHRTGGGSKMIGNLDMHDTCSSSGGCIVPWSARCFSSSLLSREARRLLWQVAGTIQEKRW